MKWCLRAPSENAVLGIAGSEGSIALYEWKSKETILRYIDKVQCAAEDTLCLSLDWSNRRDPTNNLGSLVVSLSNGSLCVLSPSETSSLSLTKSWHAHDYEPWVAAWDCWNANIIYSGGDDHKLKGWDIRQHSQQPTFTNKGFDAGVTAIQSHPHSEHIIAVGSYDNAVRLYDVRSPLAELVKVDVGGGAWRVKWHPSAKRSGDLLVACMHDGIKVIHFGLDSTSIYGKVTKRFDAHESMAYGADWSHESSRKRETIVGSCSFYDHTFHFWSG